MRAVPLVAGAALLLGGCVARPQPAPSPLPTRPPPSTAPALDGRSEPVADPVYPDFGNPEIDVLRYRLDLAWDPGTRVLSGTATLTVRPVRQLTDVVLDFAGWYTVDRVSVDGAAGRVARRGDDLIVTGAAPFPAERAVELAVVYRGTPHPVRFPGTRSDVQSLGMSVAPDGALWTMQEPYGAFTWFPCSDQPSDEALYDISITAPPGWTGVANGTPTQAGSTPAGATLQWRSPEPIATYLVTLAVDRFQRVDDTGPHGLPVTYWVRPQDADRMLPTLRQTPALLAWLEGRLGRYPFSSAGVVIVQSRSGMETQTMITLGPLAGTNAVPVLLHELAHHWFGDAVTPRTWRDLWLNEGFATYVQALFEAERLGGDLETTLQTWRSADAALRKDAGPPGQYRPDRFAARNVYQSVGLMLHELRAALGDAPFFAMMHDWAQHHLHTSQDRQSFTGWLAGYTGRDDLTPILDRWLDSPTTPL
jgi:aminopeptidase N